jgi:hypothetical protein
MRHTSFGKASTDSCNLRLTTSGASGTFFSFLAAKELLKTVVRSTLCLQGQGLWDRRNRFQNDVFNTYCKKYKHPDSSVSGL